MHWLNRKVNRTTLKNLQREETWLSKHEDDEMPGRGFRSKPHRRRHHKKQRKTKRLHR